MSQKFCPLMSLQKMKRRKWCQTVETLTAPLHSYSIVEVIRIVILVAITTMTKALKAALEQACMI